MHKIGCPMKGKLRNIIIIQIFATYRLYSNAEKPGLETIGNIIRSKQSSPRLVDK